MKVQASIPTLTMSPKEVLPANKPGGAHGGPGFKTGPVPERLLNIFNRHTVVVIAVSILVVGGGAIKLGANYWSARTLSLASNTASITAVGKPVAGFNLTVPADGFQAKLKSITHQPVTLKVGPYSERVNSDIIKKWLRISASQDKSEYYIHVNEAGIASSLIAEAKQYARSPVNQLTVSEDGTKRVVVAGQNGRSLSDPGTLKDQAHAVAKNVLAGKGLNFNTPLATRPFHSVTPIAFDKLIVADITTKKMWFFEKGKQVKSYLISAGAPDTPTPIGEFHIYSKLASQDMRGLNTDGTEYFQPHVYWVNYFSGGNAIHGVYWHPRSWFGAINSSHGCIGIPDDQAEWVYNWAPIGTTVVVHL